jgi:ubiquinone/menaquinone biosynthesis C-methylase UbiE
MCANIEYPLLPTQRIKRLVSKHSAGCGLSLDVGCGKGVYFNSFKNELIGLDLTLSFLKEAKKNSSGKRRVSLILGDIRYLPFIDKIFDFILCSQVIEHLQGEYEKKAICELERVSKGRIQIDIPNTGFLPELQRHILFKESCKDISSPNASPLYHHSVWTVKKLKAEGFEVRGCLGWVTRERFNMRFLCDLYDMLAWYIPWMAGTVIAIKYISTPIPS